jgi:flagella basal body P-ring formation protein FlgA
MLLMALMQGWASATALMPPALLQAQVEAFAGKPALVDPRLLLPACARPEMAFAVAGRSVMVRCTAPEWRVFVPVGEGGTVDAPVAVRPTPLEGPRPVPAVRRGDRVTLEVGGDGFVIGMDTIADADARDGRVALRGVAGGRRLYGIIGDDGRVRLKNPKSAI